MGQFCGMCIIHQENCIKEGGKKTFTIFFKKRLKSHYQQTSTGRKVKESTPDKRKIIPSENLGLH